MNTALLKSIEQLTDAVTRQAAQIERLAQRVSGIAQGAAGLYEAVGALIADVDGGKPLTPDSPSVCAGRDAMAEFERLNQAPGGTL